jgi:hypothetical protein
MKKFQIDPQVILNVAVGVLLTVVVAGPIIAWALYILLIIGQFMLILAIPILPVLLIALPIWIIGWACDKIQAARHR